MRISSTAMKINVNMTWREMKPFSDWSFLFKTFWSFNTSDHEFDRRQKSILEADFEGVDAGSKCSRGMLPSIFALFSAFFNLSHSDFPNCWKTQLMSAAFLASSRMFLAVNLTNGKCYRQRIFCVMKSLPVRLFLHMKSSKIHSVVKTISIIYVSKIVAKKIKLSTFWQFKFSKPLTNTTKC